MTDATTGHRTAGTAGEPSDPARGDQTDLDHLALLIRAQDAFLGSIDEVDPALPVPWCGRWRVKDLVVHLARIHHWAASQARRSREVPLGRGPFDPPALYRDCATELRETLIELGPDAPSSTLIGPGPASFWWRRQLHETTVHLWDLRTAGGLEVEQQPAVWTDTVDEVVGVLQPRQVRMGRMPPLLGGIALTADDTGRDWVLGPADREPVVHLRGSAQGLALVLWRRLTPEAAGVRVCGDVDALDSALGRRLTP